MHESDAMLFIETVIEGFFDRNFNLNESEDIYFKELCFDEIKQFIKDKEPHWVQAKSLEIIYQIETAETSIKTGAYVPTSEGAFLEAVLKRAKEKIIAVAEHFRLEKNKDKTNICVSIPVFP